ncbi:MAG: FtsQ-type POTRA domain-containing protein [candidate division Zixibacteria bacterium]|nr:FtsQ-type POTRA domain-containing protein [candidate division Zixibacteria bacterium]
MKRLIGAILIISAAVTAGRFAFIELTGLSWFCLSDVEINCPESIEKDKVLEVSKFKIGEPVFGQDFGQAADSLIKIPGIEAVSVKRRLPGSVKIDLEPEAVVLFVKKKKIYGLTRALKLVEIDRPDYYLPVVTGLSEKKTYRYRDNMKLCYSLALYENMESLSRNLSGRLAEIHFRDTRQVELIFDPGGVKVLLPLRNYQESLARLVLLDNKGILGNSGSFDMTAGKMVVKNGV